MAERPYTLLSCSASIDGYIDDASDGRLLLSTEADFQRVDEVRASCDAILVGATTIRKDNPRLLVRALPLQESRIAAGQARHPIKVTVTAGAQLDAEANFFTLGDGTKLVYCEHSAAASAGQRFGSRATVIDAGDSVTMRWISEDLHARGVRRLMVEGGASVQTQFLTAGLVDELQLVVAPFFVGNSQAPRFVGDGSYAWNHARRATLAEVRRIDDLVLLRYALSARFRER